MRNLGTKKGSYCVATLGKQPGMLRYVVSHVAHHGGTARRVLER